MKIWLPLNNKNKVLNSTRFNNTSEIQFGRETCIMNTKTKLSDHQIYILSEQLKTCDCVIYGKDFTDFDFFNIKNDCCIMVKDKFLISSNDITYLQKSILKTLKKRGSFIIKGCNDNMTFFNIIGNNGKVKVNKNKSIIKKPLPEFNYFDNDILDTTKVMKQYNILFHLIDNNKKMSNRGPFIQSENKKKYFKRDINIFNFYYKHNSNINYDWKHTLNPDFKALTGEKISIGPNIDLKKDIKSCYKRCNMVADSEWMKQHLVEKYKIDKDKIFVIPIYVNDEFHYTKPEPNKYEFTIGCIGYYQNNDIKNILSLVKICKKLKNIRFEILSSRNKELFPKEVQEISNLHFYNLPHDEIMERMKTWHGYIGLSKRERGPASIQELKVLGIPVICPLHTGYLEFNPLIGLNIKPFVSHSNNDIEKYVDAIKELQINFSYYSKKAIEEGNEFWINEKSSKHISKLWENFFIFCTQNN